MRLIKEAHAILLSGVRGENNQAGEVRKSQNWIGGADIKSASFIHPFLDGNGRIGRLLITLQLLHSELMGKPVLYISDSFERHRSEYYQALERVRLTNSLDQWLRFFLTGVIQTAQNSKKAFVEIGVLRDNYIITPREAEKILGVTAATTNRLISELQKVGILREITGFSRNRMYTLYEYLEIFKR